VPKVVRPSYVLAFGYVFADTADKAYGAFKARASTAEIVRVATDCLLWQTLASVLVPGAIINVAANNTARLVQGMQSLPPVARKWTPTIVGLGLIPFIIHPIDTGIDYVFDNTIRRVWLAEDEPNKKDP